ncbi:SubName: Full=Uncharacterized protein {ECO:0000313/EMBL:CCA69495.1} [Serendipita indica DSM 11827]|nr:SubName: Full=Uncharacterized protein {ECO:0000313/EMBL:CCA69495.1} [Serendipita indica DSM 11827]
MESFTLAIPPLSRAHSEVLPAYPTPSSSFGHPAVRAHDGQLSIDVPRLWTGLWQLSSPAWGTAPAARIRREMRKHVDRGFVAFDMVSTPIESHSIKLTKPIDLNGNFRSSLPHDLGEHVVGATKWCIFKAPQEPLTRDYVLDAVRERAKRMRVDAATKSKDCARVDFLQASRLFGFPLCSSGNHLFRRFIHFPPLTAIPKTNWFHLQFHWQDYADKRYLHALHILASLRHPATQLAYPASTLHTSSAKRLTTTTITTTTSPTTLTTSSSGSPSSVSTLTSSLRAASSLHHEKKEKEGGLTITTKIDCYPSPSSSYDSSPSSSFGGAPSPAKLALLEHEAAEKLVVHQQQQQQLQQIEDGVRIGGIGLVNFDSIRVDEICASLGPGVILTNQVQFSLIDVRPLYGMADVCKRHGLKLLTYGTLCGGFLSDKWLDAPEPNRYFDEPTLRDPLTPSQKKYLDIILSAWGTWSLFQRLLHVLRTIADRRSTGDARRVSIANVATRWVLDHDEFVGAVIIGARLGVSDNTEDNLAVAGWRLNDEERAMIADVLNESRGRELISTIGDCGAEYR